MRSYLIYIEQNMILLHDSGEKSNMEEDAERILFFKKILPALK